MVGEYLTPKLSGMNNCLWCHEFCGSRIRTQRGQFVFADVWVSAGRPEADGWTHLKAYHLTCLGSVLSVNGRLHFLCTWASHWGLSTDFLAAWGLGSKGRHPKSEKARRKLYHLLGPRRNPTAIFPPLPIHQKQAMKASPCVRGGESDSIYCWGECQSPGKNKLD